MNRNLTLGINIGTSSVKARVLNTETGDIVGKGFQTHPLILSKPGYAEQEGDSYWNAVVSAIHQCLDCGIDAGEIAGVALSGLVGVMLPIDRQGRPIRPGMIWMDARSEEECQEIRESVGEEAINYNNGNRIACWFIEPKALWMKKHEPENFDRTYKLLSPAGYCTYRLCEKFTINKGDAGLFYPFDYQKGEWNPELAEKIGIPIEKYADIYDCDEVVGTVTEQAARETGLCPGTVVMAGGTDISSAALGCGVTEANQAYYSMGTGSNLGIMIPTPERKEEFRILKWPHVIPGLTMFDAPMAFTGASLNWFNNMFGKTEQLLAEATGKRPFEILDMEAANKSRPGANGLIYLPYLGNTLSPHWNPTSKGVFFGVTLSTSREDMIQAIMEGVAFDLYSNIEIARASGAVINELTLNGGPTKSRLWNQITANVTGIPLKTTNVDEAAPLGDAILAAKGAGLCTDIVSMSKKLVTVTEEIKPDPEIHAMYMDFFEIWKDVYQKLKEDMNTHHQLLYKYKF